MSGETSATPSPEPLVVDLLWEGERRFRARSGDVEIVLDSPPTGGPTPVQALGFGIAGCMAMDVADIVRKGRLDLKGLRVHLVAQRSAEHPKRLLAVDIRFTFQGDVPADRAERAIQLSRERYCSVWHSLRQDIELTTSFEVMSKTPTAPSTTVPS
jgi:putative redox protein